MSFKNYIFCGWPLLSILLFTGLQSIAQQNEKTGRAYYVNLLGNDTNPGTVTAPFKTIGKVNGIKLSAGDSVCFKAGQTFKGSLLITQPGTGDHPVIITSYGRGKAIIDAGSMRAVSLYKTQYIIVKNLKMVGLGRKTGNRQNGLVLLNSNHIMVWDMDISGFQKSGLLIDSSSTIDVEEIFVHDNGSAGITVEGRTSKKDSRDIVITNCRAENNPGDPTMLDNHSGNGIVVGHCTNVTIARCIATNNGWDMPRIGNGPVGIWCYEADSVLIDHCLSYKNKTSKGGADGGGFDFDGGTTNSIIQYCFSHDNQGSGYCIFQYWGASLFYNNIIRNNISYNDGTVSDSQAGLYIWNSSGDPKQFHDCEVYGNIIYNTKVAAISFSEKSRNNGFHFYHNVFVGRDTLIKGRDSLGKCKFEGNDWWSMKSGFNIDGIKSLKAWAKKIGQEQKGGKIVGLNINPLFRNPDWKNFTSLRKLNLFTSGYKLSKTSALKKLFGGDLQQTNWFNYRIFTY
jgi:hypothetical protein